MKKLIAMLMALVMIAACFAGCSGQNADQVQQDASANNGAASDNNPVADNNEPADDVDAPSADTDSDKAYILDKGSMIVGITDYAPMDFKDENGEWTGFDAEFGRIVGEKMGVEIIFQEIQWSSKFFELEGKTIDCIWNGMTISDEVLLNTNCSDPYVKNAQVVVMKADKVAQFTDAASMADLLFAAEEGSAGESALLDNGLTNYTPVLDQATALMEVAAGTADACVIDLTMANAMTGEGTSYDNLAKGIELTSEEYGVGFRKGSDMTDWFNEIMAELMADGSLDALADKYQLTLVK